MINPNETPRFDTLFRFTHGHEKGLYTFCYSNGNEEIVRYDTDYETDNNLELDDPDYEEFFAIVFRRESGELFEVTYHNLPDSIFCDGKRVI